MLPGLTCLRFLDVASKDVSSPSLHGLPMISPVSVLSSTKGEGMHCKTLFCGPRKREHERVCLRLFSWFYCSECLLNSACTYTSSIKGAFISSSAHQLVVRSVSSVMIAIFFRGVCSTCKLRECFLGLDQSCDISLWLMCRCVISWRPTCEISWQ